MTTVLEERVDELRRDRAHGGSWMARRAVEALVRSSRELRGAIAAALRSSRIGLALVEELVEEPVVTVSAFSRNGAFHPLAVTDRAPLAHVWESPHAERAALTAARAARALGIREGPTITQLVVGAGGPKVLELSARIGGGHEPDLCHAAVGVDVHSLALSAALGEPVSAKRLRTKRRVGGACVRFLDGTGPAEGLAEAESLPGVEWARVHGDTDRAGAVLATGASPAEALERATLAAECIRFRPPHAHAV